MRNFHGIDVVPHNTKYREFVMNNISYLSKVNTYALGRKRFLKFINNICSLLLNNVFSKKLKVFQNDFVNHRKLSCNENLCYRKFSKIKNRVTCGFSSRVNCLFYKMPNRQAVPAYGKIC